MVKQKLPKDDLYNTTIHLPQKDSSQFQFSIAFLWHSI